MGQGSAALAWLVGDMDGDGRSDIFQPFNNQNNLGLIVYRSTGTGFATAFTSGNLGPASNMVAWQTGDFDGDGFTDIFQARTTTWNVYLSSGSGYSLASSWNFYCCIDGQLGWLMGSFDGGPRESLLFLFPSPGGVALLVYGAQ